VILVAGGTGRLGTELVGRLVAGGEQVRVLTRDAARAAHLPPVEVVVGDVRRPGDVARAVAGADAVVSAVHGFTGRGVSPASVDRDGNACLVDAAAGVGAHVVLVSGLGAAPDHPIELFRMKAAAEQHLRASGAPWTIVRAGAFLELYRDLFRRTAGRTGRPLVLGRGDNPVTFAAVPDVAGAVVCALTDPACRDVVLEVPGRTMTFDELAAAMEPELGAGARSPRHVPRLVLRLLAVAGATTPGRLAAAALVMDTSDVTASRAATVSGG
jgi:NADH dehydrogenase